MIFLKNCRKGSEMYIPAKYIAKTKQTFACFYDFVCQAVWPVSETPYAIALDKSRYGIIQAGELHIYSLNAVPFSPGKK